MDNCPDKKEFTLIGVIVNFGLGTKIIKFAKQHGVSGGTILLGKGTVRNCILEFLELCDVRKEIVLMIAEKTIANNTMDELDRKFNFHKPNHGIAFSIPVLSLIGVRGCSADIVKESGGAQHSMYKAIFVVVDKGKAEAVIEVATKAGSRGGTIINARGSGIHETSKLFNMDIEPEKEIVLILAANSLVEPIVSSIREEMQIDEPGKGIIFIQDVNKTYGLY